MLSWLMGGAISDNSNVDDSIRHHQQQQQQQQQAQTADDLSAARSRDRSPATGPIMDVRSLGYPRGGQQPSIPTHLAPHLPAGLLPNQRLSVEELYNAIIRSGVTVDLSLLEAFRQQQLQQQQQQHQQMQVLSSMSSRTRSPAHQSVQQPGFQAVASAAGTTANVPYQGSSRPASGSLADLPQQSSGKSNNLTPTA
ncbi:unnamed protein product [Dibothriocephalus latus]|uniref:Uncharacterized protein n=1 Tax=Dibothriocephalus latus TaxID=60516 RepID=A0A3P7LRM5_DIBLA|nr:unnamed protein product [Dibothriocephalus latus]